MTQMNIFDFVAAEEAKNVGVASVLSNNGRWSDKAMASLRVFAGRAGRAFTTEEFRISGLVDPPNHPNAWGALFNGAARKGIIRQVGYAKPSNVRSHSSVVMTWESA